MMFFFALVYVSKFRTCFNQINPINAFMLLLKTLSSFKVQTCENILAGKVKRIFFGLHYKSKLDDVQ